MPADHGTHRDFIEPWARALEARSDGRLRVTVHTATPPLGALERQYEQVATRRGRRRPLGREPSRRVASPARSSPARRSSSTPRRRGRGSSPPSSPRTCAAEYTRAGLHVLALHADSGGLLHTREPIATLDDLRGRRIRAPSRLVASVLGRARREARRARAAADPRRRRGGPARRRRHGMGRRALHGHGVRLPLPSGRRPSTSRRSTS